MTDCDYVPGVRLLLVLEPAMTTAVAMMLHDTDTGADASSGQRAVDQP